MKDQKELKSSLRSLVLGAVVLLASAPQAIPGDSKAGSWCNEAGGAFNSDNVCVCSCSGVPLAIDDKNAKEKCLSQLATKTGDVLNQLSNQNGANPNGQPACLANTARAEAPPINPNLACPRFLNRHLGDDNESGWFGTVDAPYKLCNVDIKQQTLGVMPKDFQTAGQVEAYFESQPETRLGTPPGMLDSCIPRDVTVSQGRGRTKKISNFYPEAERRSIVSEYYDGMNRLKVSELSTIQSIASLDSILQSPRDSFYGNSGANTCEDNKITETAAVCAKLRSCQPAGGLSSMAADTALALRLVDGLKDDIKTQTDNANKIAKKWFHKTDGFEQKQIDDMRALAQQETEKVELMEHLYPWMEGDLFKKATDGSKKRKNGQRYDAGNIEKAMRNQFAADRALLAKKLVSYQKATSCLNSPNEDKVNCKNFDKTISETAPSPRLVPKDPENDMHEILANKELDDMSCLREARGIRSDANKAYESFARDAAISAVTFGAGAYFAAGKVAVSATVAGGSKLLNLGSKVVETVKSANTVAGAAKLAVMGTAYYYMGSAMVGVIDACALKMETTLQNTNEFKPDAAGPSCPAAPLPILMEPSQDLSALAPTAITADRSFKNCAINGGLAALQALPLAGSLMTPALKRMIAQYAARSKVAAVLTSNVSDLAKGQTTASRLKIEADVHVQAPEEQVKVSEKFNSQIQEFVARQKAGKPATLEDVQAVLKAELPAKTYEDIFIKCGGKP
jgi:hypothetical protein